ncbi:hypothetical protein AVEN_7824-1 [Araneus ventricosus]|uniref:Uncharacterized protein n=1 Tax=Araneus ventricosus TaxID=182803 RepID=A0A4Y2F2M5_ARAVE|nr:hypothetical protein AVEN_7824-1 [Araneus ventricosus]
MEGIFPPDCLKLFEQNELADVQNEQINSFSSEIQNKLPLFSAVLHNESLDLTHIIDSSLGDQVQHLVKGYEPAKEPKVTRSYPNLEIEPQGTSGNCSDPLSIPDGVEEEKSSSHQQGISTTADNGVIDLPGLPAINKTLASAPSPFERTLQGTERTDNGKSVVTKCGKQYSAVSDAGKLNTVTRSKIDVGASQRSQRRRDPGISRMRSRVFEKWKSRNFFTCIRERAIGGTVVF